jgi:uracil DNA glycosylase
VLDGFLKSSEFKKIGKELKEMDGEVFPDFSDMFNAFRLCPYSKVITVMLTSNPFSEDNMTGLALNYSYSGKGDDSSPSKLREAIFNAVKEDCQEGASNGQNRGFYYSIVTLVVGSMEKSHISPCGSPLLSIY